MGGKKKEIYNDPIDSFDARVISMASSKEIYGN